MADEASTPSGVAALGGKQAAGHVEVRHTIVRCKGSIVGPDGVRKTCRYRLETVEGDIHYLHVPVRRGKQGFAVLVCPNGHEWGLLNPAKKKTATD